MKARSILMSAPMVNALLDGRKTQTRRMVKEWRYGIDFVGGVGDDFNDPTNWGVETEAGWIWLASDSMSGAFQLRNPYGYAGDLLWVRETAAWIGEEYWIYRATDEAWAQKEIIDTGVLDKIAWKPSIHMPRHASRLTLELTNVRVERLQDISEEDAVAEGFQETCISWWQGFRRHEDGSRGMIECGDGTGEPPEDLENAEVQRYVQSASHKFKEYFHSLNKMQTINANPWVWVLSFNVHQVNVDEFLRRKAA